ncbi:MAG: RagB/SusD family nutrient uptake outer membrane protein, partial [Bacteroidota bacterium]
MKQNPIIISLFTLSILFMVSCNDFLEEEPQDRIVAENFFVSEEALGAALTAAYRQLVNDQWNRGLGSARLRANFCGADDWTSQPGGNKGAFRDGDQLNIFPTTVETSNAGWGLGYDVILQANFTIQGGEQMIDNGFDADEVNATLGEAYFLRAWAYFYLVRLYGGLPIVLDPFFTEENRQLGRSPESEVYDRILEDLTFALDHLPPATPAENGRASFWAAKALRAQVYLTMASWPLKEAGRFEDALNDAEDIINEGPFSLVPSFPALFAIENEDTNTEYIWQLNFCSDIQCPGEQLFTPFASQTTKPAELGGFQDLFIEKAFFNRFPEGERKDFTFLTELISANGPNIPWQEFIWKRPFLSKFYSGTVDKNAPFEAQVGVTAQASGIDMPMFRLAEIYLIYAEAHVM